MASRLYRSTRQLYLAVAAALLRLPRAGLGTPTRAALIALAVTGRILRDARPTPTRVARVLPGRQHDALGRLRRTLPFSPRARLALRLACAKRLGRPGDLILDDVMVEQARAHRWPWAARSAAFAKQRTVWGFQRSVLEEWSCAGQWRIPVGVRLWRPTRTWRATAYQTPLAWAEALVRAVVLSRLPVPSIVCDTHATAAWCTKRRARLGVVWHGPLDPKTSVVWRGQKQSVRDVAPRVKLTWRAQLGVRARARRVAAPTDGQLRMVVVNNRHGHGEDLVTNDGTLDLSSIVLRKRTRWSIEPVFRDSQQWAGFEAGQCRADVALVRHVALVLVTLVVFHRLRQSPHEAVGAVKERWQLAVLRAGEAPPAPLRACPPELRPTA